MYCPLTGETQGPVIVDCQGRGQKFNWLIAEEGVAVGASVRG